MKRIGRRGFIQTLGAVAGSEIIAGGCASRPGGAVRVAQRPNVLFLFPDQHRFDWIGTNPDIPVRTPNLDALGQRGVRFSHAFSPAPVCAPARACLAAGLEYERCGVASNGVDYPLSQTTYYTLLRDSGYHVAGCGKFDLHKPSPSWGLDGKHLLPEWGFSDGIDNAGKYDAVRASKTEPKDPYMAFLYRRGLAKAHIRDLKERHSYTGTYPTPLPDDAYCDNWIGENGLKLMQAFPEGKPWHLVVNFTGPHNPMDVTKSMHPWYRDVDFPQPNRNTQYDAATHVAIRRNYSAMVENIDRWLGIYIERLRQRGELENTLIVYSSDHGEMLGDHDLWAKSKPYQPSVSVPLVMAGPGVAPKGDCDAPVSMMDCAATFLECARVLRPETMDSRSLCPILSGKEDSVRSIVRSGLGKWRVVSDGRYKLIRGYEKAGGPMLFDLLNDPFENENLYSARPSDVKRLEAHFIESGSNA